MRLSVLTEESQLAESKVDALLPGSGFQFTDLFFDKALWHKIRKPIISFFLCFQLTAFILYLLLPNHVLARLTEPFQKYLAFFCLFQGYGVFSPSPSTRNAHIIALVQYDDGSTRLYNLPRLDRTSLLEKLTQERYRKFLEDNLPAPANTNIVPDVARFVARQCDIFKPNADGTGIVNRPKMVLVIDFWSEAPPIHKQLPNPPHFNMRVLLSYPVKPEDLQT